MNYSPPFYLLNSIDVGIWIFDIIAEKITYSNSAFEKLFGFKPAENDFKINFWADYIHPEDKIWVEETINGKLNEERKVEVEYRIITKNGKVRWVSSKIVIINDEHNNPVRHEGIITDISKLKSLEVKFYQSESSYRYLFENNPYPMWIYDMRTYNFMAVNNAAMYQYGYSREEFLSMTILQIRPEEDEEKVKISVNKADNNSFNYYDAGFWKHLKKTGEMIQVEISSHEINFLGRKSRMVLAKDVTKRLIIENEVLQLNEELKSSEEELRQTLESTNDLNDKLLILKEKLETAQNIAHIGNWDWDTQNKTFFCSDEVYEIFGLDKDEFEITFQSFLSLVHPEDQTFANYAHLNVDKALNVEYRIIRPDNQVRYVHSIGKTHKSNEGIIIRIVGTIQDITERKEYEIKLEQQNLQLSEIAKISAHKIRRPVSSILGLVKIFDKNNPEAEINSQIIDMLEQVTLELDEVIHEIVAKTQ